MHAIRLFAALAVTLCAASASAGVVSVGTAQTAVPAGLGCDGCIANDISINFDGNLRGQQLYVNLASGSVWNELIFGSDFAPGDALFGGFPSVEFDSFVAIGGLTSSTSEDVLLVGGAVDIPGAPAAGSIGNSLDNAAPGNSTVSIAWAPRTGIDVPSGANYPVARITLSPNANGDAWIFSSTSGDDPALLTRRSIISGVIVPEPASMALAGFAWLGLALLLRVDVATCDRRPLECCQY